MFLAKCPSRIGRGHEYVDFGEYLVPLRPISAFMRQEALRASPEDDETLHLCVWMGASGGCESCLALVRTRVICAEEGSPIFFAPRSLHQRKSMEAANSHGLTCRWW